MDGMRVVAWPGPVQSLNAKWYLPLHKHHRFDQRRALHPQAHASRRRLQPHTNHFDQHHASNQLPSPHSQNPRRRLLLYLRSFGIRSGTAWTRHSFRLVTQSYTWTALASVASLSSGLTEQWPQHSCAIATCAVGIGARPRRRTLSGSSQKLQ